MAPGSTNTTTITASPTTADGDLPRTDSIIGLRDALATGSVAVLTGAGMSTESGIPDYRGPDSPPRTPMTYQQFISDPAFRRHYWARNHVGWRFLDSARPNDGHRAVADLERAGRITGVITQNVDMLHTKAGSRAVIDLHGVYGRVRCLSCDTLMSRHHLDEILEDLNPGFAEHYRDPGMVELAPDADAVITDTSHFSMIDCPRCGGILKPDIVYFGESVPAERVARCFDLIDRSTSVVVLGSSLTVMSGLRFVRHAFRQGKPIHIVNRGATRADDIATTRINAGCSDVLLTVSTALRYGAA